MPFPPSAGKDLPLSEENSDLSILSVRDSSSGHEIEQTPWGSLRFRSRKKMFSGKKLTLNRVNFLTKTCSRTRRTVDRRSMKVSPSV